MLMKEVPFPKPAIEALRGSAQHVLAQGQSEAHGDSKLRFEVLNRLMKFFGFEGFCHSISGFEVGWGLGPL